MSLYKRNALTANPSTVNGRTADIHITRRGSAWYYAVCGMMGATSLAVMLLALMKPRRERLFYYTTAAITLVASIAYWTMGSNLGFTPIGVEYHRSEGIVRGNYREIFYVRYIDWFITTPLLLLELLLTAGMPWPTIWLVILLDWVMVVCGLVGALVRSAYKWGYFFIALMSLFYIIYALLFEGRRQAQILGPDISRAFLITGSILLLTWVLYPIAWACSEGGNVIAPDSEAIFYGILDIISKIIFSAVLLWFHRSIDPRRLGLAIREYEEDPTVTGSVGSEKKRHREADDRLLNGQGNYV